MRPEPFLGKGGSEFWRSLCESPKRSPKLFLPVDVEVRVEGSVGVGRLSSLGMFLRELSVEDLPRIPSRDFVGEECVDALESWRISGDPGMANDIEDIARALCDGDGRGEENPEPSSAVIGIRSALTAGESELGLALLLPLPKLPGTDNEPPFSGDMILGGRGNSGPGFFLRGSRKNVVVVCIVCVVVVVAYRPWSPELASDREDSDSRLMGRANVELDSSP